MVAGMPIFMTEAQSAGEVAFSRDEPGHVLPLHLQPGRAILVREHQFLAATANVDYTFNRVKGMSNMLFGGTGLLHRPLRGPDQRGRRLAPRLRQRVREDARPRRGDRRRSRRLDLPRCRTSTCSSTVYGLKTGLFGGGGNLVFNRFTGPGRVGIQSAYVHLPTEN